MSRHPLAPPLLSFLLAIATTGCASSVAAGRPAPPTTAAGEAAQPTTSAGRAAQPTTGEETGCPNPGVSASPNSDPVGILQKQIADALPCAFTSTAYEPAGSKNLVIYLTPLNTHTRNVAQAIVDASPVSKVIPVSLKQGSQSFSRAEEQSAAISGSIPHNVQAPISVDRYGVVTVEIYGHPVSDASIVAASHVPGYQAEPVIVHDKKPIVFCPGGPGCPSEAIQ